MDLREIKEGSKKGWDWLWHSDSIWSWVVVLILAYVVVKLIFFPTLSFITGGPLPLLIVESSSMDHSAIKTCLRYSGASCDSWSGYEICGKSFDKKTNLNQEEYWETCGGWYEGRSIEKESLLTIFKNGFEKGDIIFVWGRFEPEIGDVVIFTPGAGSSSPRPIIHRIVSVEDGVIQTKGDHNSRQLDSRNNNYNTDETNILEEQLVGKAVFRVPKLGWIKLVFVEMFQRLVS